MRRALIIDAQLPRPEHDAGSQAILSHAAALAGLGFQVEFVAAHQLARADQASAALEQAGYVVHRVPLVASVEEVLRRHRNTFDVVYLHRLANAEAYARWRGPGRHGRGCCTASPTCTMCGWRGRRRCRPPPSWPTRRARSGCAS